MQAWLARRCDMGRKDIQPLSSGSSLWASHTCSVWFANNLAMFATLRFPLTEFDGCHTLPPRTLNLEHVRLDFVHKGS